MNDKGTQGLSIYGIRDGVLVAAASSEGLAVPLLT